MSWLDGLSETAQAQAEERGELRPEHVDADALQEDAADDDEEVTQRVDEREPLHDLRHVGDGVDKARQQHGGKEEED